MACNLRIWISEALSAALAPLFTKQSMKLLLALSKYALAGKNRDERAYSMWWRILRDYWRRCCTYYKLDLGRVGAFPPMQLGAWYPDRSRMCLPRMTLLNFLGFEGGCLLRIGQSDPQFHHPIGNLGQAKYFNLREGIHSTVFLPLGYLRDGSVLCSSTLENQKVSIHPFAWSWRF